MRATLLDERRRAVLNDERRLLTDVVQALERLDISSASRDALRHSTAQLDDPFLLVIVGEFNAGKSALINALLGRGVLEEGVTPTTARIGVLRFGEAVTREPSERGFDVVTAAVELLRDINIVDTPGTNAILRQHEALTRDFVPRADLVLFITSADRPFTESERVFLEAIRQWGKPVLVAVNKMDLLETATEHDTILAFVRTHATALLGWTPDVFGVSARQALRARLASNTADVERSGLVALERFIETSLDDGERFRLKLRNPLGVARRVAGEASRLVDDRLALLHDDFAVVEGIEGELRVHREDVGRDLRFRLAAIDQELLAFEKRGEAFFDEMLRLGRLPDLLNRHKVAAAFEKEAVAGLPERIERRVEAIVEWMAESELRLWRGISEQLGRRQAAHADRLAGSISGPFESDRTRLLQGVRREAQRAVESYDQAAESRRLADSVRDAVARAALLQAGALGWGTLVTAVASTTVADVTGLLAAGVLSVLGFLVLPARRRSARRELASRVARLRTMLMDTMSAKTGEELQASERRIEAALAPYTRFVRAEGERFTATRDHLASLEQHIDAMRARVDAL